MSTEETNDNHPTTSGDDGVVTSTTLNVEQSIEEVTIQSDARSSLNASNSMFTIVWDNKRKTTRKSNRVTTTSGPSDLPAPFLPPLAARNSGTQAIDPEELKEFARKSLAKAREPPLPPVTDEAQATSRSSVNADAIITEIASASTGEPDTEAMPPSEVYFVDESTGKALVTKTTTHRGRPAEVTVELGSEGQVVQVVGGTARLPGEPPRQYFRKMSSFAAWQLHDFPRTTRISWNGDQKYAYFSYLIILITGIILCVEIGVNGGTYHVTLKILD